MKINTIFDKKLAAVLLVILGGLLAFSPAGTRTADNYSVDELTASIVEKSNYITADVVAEMIIDKRPDYLLIDIRNAEEYEKFHIEGAFNIPLSDLFSEDNRDYFDTDQNIVLYSNGNTNASMAWLMLQQNKIDSYVLQGGMNFWAKAIMNPEAPQDLIADSELLLYQFRKSASGYFSGGVIANAGASLPNVKIDPSKLKKKKKKKKGGSCFE